MESAECKERAKPISNGITEAAYTLIFHQRLKRSGVRWRKKKCQYWPGAVLENYFATAFARLIPVLETRGRF